MYTPPFMVLLKQMGVAPEEFRAGRDVTVPADLLKMLLQIALANSDFDEKGYLQANPDIDAAQRHGDIQDARLHYIGDGYFECRNGGHPAVDERWYLSTYPDVAAGVRARKIGSAKEHFVHAGAAEFRAPSETYVRDAMHWAKALGKV